MADPYRFRSNTSTGLTSSTPLPPLSSWSTQPTSPSPSPASSPRAQQPAQRSQTQAPQTESQELIKLPPLLSHKPMPTPTRTKLPPIRLLFRTFPPLLPALPPKDPIPDVSSLFTLLLPRNKPPPPLCDNIGDITVRVHVCATCGSANPTMACPQCHLLHYCSATTCLLRDYGHQQTCTRYNQVAATVYSQPFNHAKRFELVQILEGLFKRQRTQHLLQMAIWHRNEIMRLSQNDPMRMQLEFPFNLLRTGENDAVVSFVRHWALEPLRVPTEEDRYIRSAPGDRTYPINLDRYDDAISENVPHVAVPLTHLVSLCLVKIRIIASMNARMADERQKVFWHSAFGTRLSAASGARLEDFFVRGGRSRYVGQAQVSILTKYLLLIRQRNPIMEYVIRDANVLRNGPPGGYEASYGEAKGIWDAIGDLFVQIPSYPGCVF